MVKEQCDWCPPKFYIGFPPCFKVYPGKYERKNPGNVQELHCLAHRIMPKFYDGLELDYVHRLAANKYITCNWVLSHTRPSGFRFGGIYTMFMHKDVLHTPTIRADINPSTFSSNVNVSYFPFSFLCLEANLQRVSDDIPLATQFMIELQRPFATITANFYNVSRSSGRSTLSFMRSISAHWAIGAELLMEWSNPNPLMAYTALAARYSKYNYSLATTFSQQGLDISFWQRIHDRIQMATLLAWNRKTQKTIGTIAYQWDFEDSVLRGMIDSDMSVGFAYQRFLPYMPCGAGMSLMMSLPTNRFIFGLKFILDPSGYRRGE